MTITRHASTVLCWPTLCDCSRPSPTVSWGESNASVGGAPSGTDKDVSCPTSCQ